MRKFETKRIVSLLCVCLLIFAAAVFGAGCEKTEIPQKLPGSEVTVPEKPDGGKTEPAENPGDGEDGETENPEESENPSQGDGDTSTEGGEEEKPEKPEEPENPEPPQWASDYTLPESSGALARLNEIYGGEEKVFLLQTGKILRMPCPKDGASMAVNFTFEPSDYAKPIFEDCIDEFNDVFAVINPNYKFEINYAPTADDLKSEYSIRVSTVQNFTRPNTLGTAAHSYYGETICNFSVQLRYDVPNNGSYIMSVFRHELMHLLGAGDAYNNPNATTDTVMQGYSLKGPFTFSNSDVAFLDALYRNPSIGKTDAEMAEFTAHYADNNTHSYAALESATLNAATEKITAQSLSESVESADYTDADTDEVLGFLSESGLVFDRTFGQTSVSFTELTPAVENEETVYYGGKFDISSGQYWHSTKKYGSTITNSMGIKYADYGNGILFAAPGGTAQSTYFMKSGNYVFAFAKAGGFTDLGALSMPLRRVYKI